MTLPNGKNLYVGSTKYHDLTQRQGEVYDYMHKFWAEHGYSPTVREVCEAFGMRSPNGAQGYFVALERKGYIRRDVDGGSRALVFLRSEGALVVASGRKVMAKNIPTHMSGEDAVAIGRSLIAQGEIAMAYRARGGADIAEAAQAST